MADVIPANRSVREAAKILNVSEKKVRKLIDFREIPHVRIGRRVLIPQSEIDRYLSKNTIPAFDKNSVQRFE